MAVSNEQAPNLAGSYENIIGQLQQRAGMEATRKNGFDVATGVVNTADKEMQKARDFAQQQAAAGKVLFTPDKIQQVVDKVNAEIPEGKPKVKTSDYSSFANTWGDRDAVQNKAEQDLFASSFTDPQKARAAAIDPKAAAASVLARDKNLLKIGRDDNSSTGWSYFNIDPIHPEAPGTNAGVEAPVPAGFNKTQGTWATTTDPNTGLTHRINSTTNEDKVLFAPKNRPIDQLITKTEQLYPVEKKAIEKAKYETKAQVKPIIDSLEKADSLISDVNANNPNTLLNIRAELAKLGAGIPGSKVSLGVMQNEALSPGLADRAEQALVKMEGKKALSDTNKAAILQYINEKKAQKVKELNDTIQGQADSLSLPDVHPDFLKSELAKSYGRFLNTIQTATDKSTGKTHKVEVDPNGKIIKVLE